jgi:hypothetical protein
VRRSCSVVTPLKEGMVRKSCTCCDAIKGGNGEKVEPLQEAYFGTWDECAGVKPIGGGHGEWRPLLVCPRTECILVEQDPTERIKPLQKTKPIRWHTLVPMGRMCWLQANPIASFTDLSTPGSRRAPCIVFIEVLLSFAAL